MKRQWKVMTTVVLTFIFFILGKTVCLAAWDESRPIKVGIFPLGNFQNYDENGEEYGYNIEYLNKIAELEHWEFEYVRLNNWVEATGYLEQGKIDLLAPAQNIPSLSERFAYAAFPMGTEAAAIYVPNEREELIYQDFARMKALRYGGVEDSTFTRNFLKRAEEKGFEPDLKYYSDTSSLFEALERGEVEAVVTNIMFDNENLKILDRFSPLPVYYISSKDNTHLLDEFYEAMCAVELNDPSFETRLMAEFFPYYSNADFTYDELEYIKSMPSITIGYWADGRPLSYQNKETGEFDGITRDILDRISEITGLSFTYVALPDTQIDMKTLQEQNIYALCGVTNNVENRSISQMWLSMPYFYTEKVLVGPEELDFSQNSNLKLATPTGSPSFLNRLKALYPDFEVEMYSDVEECFDKIKKGEADILIQNRYVVEPYLAKPIYQNMKILPVESMDDNLCIATVHQPGDTSETQQNLEDSRFISIINKAIQRLNEEKVNDIIIHRTSQNQYRYKLSDFIYQYRYMLLIISLFLAIFAVCAIQISRLKARENKILSHAIEQANRANVAKSQFLSNMSHEIRTPLNAIVGMTSLAQKISGNPEKTTQYLGKITESSKMLMSIINDVLDMSAIESQKLRISEQTFDFKTLLTSLSELYYTQCKQKGIHFEMHLEGVKREVLVGDSLRVNQILMNLLSNAYKFTDAGGDIIVTITETMVSDDQKKVYMRFAVADTGCGMNEEMQSRLFKAFEQESADTALRHGGSGLGLAITKNLVSLMRGEIKVESKKDVGTTFTVDLPFGITDDVILSDTTRFEGMRVMVVDDDSYMCEYIDSILSGMGISFDVVGDGETALGMLENEQQSDKPYDVCLIDWRMPNMDGIEVAKQIRKRISDDILTIIISAYDMSEVADEAREAGIDQVISKPLFQSSVYNILMSVHKKNLPPIEMQEEEYDFTGKRALLAEDFELNREMAVDLLGMVQLSVDCAEDGKQAVDMFADAEPGTYDIIFMDIQMPNMNGYEAMKAIRSLDHSQAKNIPIYAMTANAFAEDVAKALSAGANGHIAKPIDSKALYKLIDKCLSEKE